MTLPGNLIIARSALAPSGLIVAFAAEHIIGTELASQISFFDLSEVIASMSYALDLTEGQPAGHTIRSCAIGMRIGQELDLGADELHALFYALLLKDCGCSTNAAPLAAAFDASDQTVKFDYKKVDWNNPWEGAKYVWRNLKDNPIGTRIHRFTRIALGKEFDTRSLVRIRCERGGDIVAGLGFPVATADAIRALDEHWDGRGQPYGLRGTQIPQLARIAGLAQTAEVFAASDGWRVAMDVIKARSSTWFDPELVRLFTRWRNDTQYWTQLQAPDLVQRIESLQPRQHARVMNDAGLNQVVEAFAEIIDAKSPYTFRHSSGVATYATAIAQVLQLSPTEQQRIRRASLLHDIGKLGVSNTILDKPGKLTAEEWQQVERHPTYTWEILKHVRAFEDFAWMAALHHERLDGSGYPWRLQAKDLEVGARIIAVADVFEALTADRPYRAGLSPAVALALLQAEAGTKVDPDVVAALATHLAAHGP